MRINYVLIDLENIQPDTLAGLDTEHFRVIVFVGASQAKVAFDLASEMQKLGPKAEYIKITGNGNNALDFHVAYYIGKLSALDATAYFHIISKDTGFDPLIQHLKDRKIGATRCKTVEDIPLLKVSNSNSAIEKSAVIIENLRQRGASRPRTLKTLTSTISSLFQKKLTAEELKLLVTELEKMKVILINGQKISYMLPQHK